MDHDVDHAAKEGDQPDQPDKDAQFMKILNALFLFGEQHNGGSLPLRCGSAAQLY